MSRRGEIFRGVLVASAFVPALVIGVSCDSVPTNPSTPFSFTIDTFPAPSIVVNDTMRDSTGTVQPITVEVFNSEGHQIQNVPLTFLPYDPTELHFDSLHHAIAGTYGDSMPQFYIGIGTGTLQSAPQSIPVVFPPDSVEFADSDSIQTDTGYLQTATSAAFETGPLDGLLRHVPDTVGEDSITESYLVRYQIVYPSIAAGATGTMADTALPIFLVNSGGTPSIVDTTNTLGTSTRYVILNLNTTNYPTLHAGTTDSVVIQLTATYRHQQVPPGPSTPKQFVVYYLIQNPP